MEVRFLGKRMEVLLSEETLQARVAELGAQITRDYADRETALVLLVVLKGSVPFAADLMRHIDLPVELECMGLSSYGSSTETSGVVRVTLDLSKPVAGKDVLVIEDIIDTGLTMEYLISNLQTRKPASLKVCTLLTKPSRARVEVPADYVGFSIEDHFVIGYGLDYDQKYRNLRYIGYMVDE
ncbi:MAG: hypoxanthine phosphoribosyltransferase [Myxococcota bacterium]|jgi:hypoxanthine phosphoribosyltransferase